MSNISNNKNESNNISLYKRSLEDVAKILLERRSKVLKYNTINEENQNLIKKNNNQIRNKGTLRDSLISIFSAFKKNNNNQNSNNNQNLNNNLTNSNSNKKENKFHRYIKHKSSEFTKSTENNSNNSNSSLENLFLNNNNEFKFKLTLTGKLEKKILKENEIVEEENYSSSSQEKEEYNFFNNEDEDENNKSEIYEIVNTLVNEENMEQIKNLYEEIIIEFKNSKNKKEDENSLLKKKFLSYQYIKFIFGDEISTIITQHPKNKEIIEFILYQIYYFISILFIEEEENIFKEDIIMSYLTVFTYSSENFNIISNIVIEENIQDLTLSQQTLKTQNKIIKSIIPKISLFIPNELILILQSNKPIKYIINSLFNNYLLNNKLNDIEKVAMNINEENKFLPEIDKNKYLYTLIIDLDETLVHYIEEENRAYVKVRYGAENFLSDLSKMFEIIIFTDNTKDYADIILDNIDHDNKYISYRLYREHIINYNIKDINKIGRDLEKSIIIDNDEECFSLQKENGLKIKNFNGEEEDRELIYLKNDLIYLMNKTIKEENGDIRKFIPEIQEKMNKRYSMSKE